GPLYSTASGWHDFDGDGVLDQPVLLQGHECLAFFLGGIPGASGAGMAGFAKDPVNPFRSDNPANAGYTASRNPPLFEFKGDRLLDPDANGYPGYVDSLGRTTDARYYAYFSAYGNGGYDPND